MESMGYVLMYFNRTSLPWQGLKAATKKQKYEKISEKKLSTPIEVLCKVRQRVHCSCTCACRNDWCVSDVKVCPTLQWEATSYVACSSYKFSIFHALADIKTIITCMCRDSQPSLQCTWTTVVVFALKRPPTTCTSGSYSGSSSALWTINMTTPLTGRYSNRRQLHLPRPVAHCQLVSFLFNAHH